MKKILLLTGLIFVPLFTHTMEPDNINPDVFKGIERNNPFFTFIKKNQSPDGTKIVTLSNAGTVSLWDGKTGKSLDPSFAKDKLKAQSVGFSPDGTKVIIKTLQGTEEYDLTTLVDFDVFKGIERNNPFFTFIKKSQSPDGTKIVTLSNAGTLSLWDGKTGKSLEPSLAKDKLKAQSVGFNPDGTKVIIKTAQGTEEYSI